MKRWVKLLGVACGLGLLAMAVAGTGTASASETGLCKAAEASCANAWSSETEFTATSPKTVFTGTIAFSCETTIAFKTRERNGEPLGIQGTSATWSNCTNGAEVTTTKLPTATIAASGGGNGTLTLSGWALEVKHLLGFTEACAITMNGVTLPFTGGTGSAHFTADNASVAVKGFGCGSTATWNAGGGHGGSPFTIVSAREPGQEAVKNPAVFAEVAIPIEGSSTETELCRANEPCAGANAWASGTVFTAKSPNVEIVAWLRFHCESTISFKALAAAGNPMPLEVTEAKLSNCGVGRPKTTLLPTATIAASGSGNGALALHDWLVVIEELAGSTCTFDFESNEVDVVGGRSEHAELSVDNQPVAVSGFGCGTVAHWNASAASGGVPFVIVSAKEPGGNVVSNPPLFVKRAP